MSNFHSSAPVILKGVRLQWLNIYSVDQESNKFKVVALMKPTDESVNVAKTAMLEAAKGLWKENALNVVKSMGTNNKAVRDGNDKMDDAGNIKEQFKDMLYISASNKADRRPQIVAQKKHNGKFVHITEDGRALVDGIEVTAEELGYQVTTPYRGSYANIKVEFCAGKSFKTKDNKTGKEEVVPNQVFARILAVQFVKDGEAFGGGSTSAEGFDDEEVTAVTGGADELF